MRLPDITSPGGKCWRPFLQKANGTVLVKFIPVYNTVVFLYSQVFCYSQIYPPASLAFQKRLKTWRHEKEQMAAEVVLSERPRTSSCRAGLGCGLYLPKTTNQNRRKQERRGCDSSPIYCPNNVPNSPPDILTISLSPTSILFSYPWSPSNELWTFTLFTHFLFPFHDWHVHLSLLREEDKQRVRFQVITAVKMSLSFFCNTVWACR